MRHVLALLVAVLPLSACGGCEPPLPAGAVCGSGAIDNAAHALDADASRFLILVRKVDGAGCGFAHNHVVRASQAVMEFDVDSASLAAGTITVTVAANGLDPDEDALRGEFYPGEPLLSEGDRKSVRGSALDEVAAEDHPTLTFVASGLSAISGEGTASLKAIIAGKESTVPLSYTITKNGDAYEVAGTAVIDGAPHNIPHGPLGFCVEKEMEVRFNLRLTPGQVQCEGLPPPPPPFTPTFFDDQACAETVSFNEARDVVGVRCMGCHMDPPRGGATIPLIEWEHFRFDSLRNQGEAAYLTAHRYINLNPDDGLAMPTIDASPLGTPASTDCTWCVEDELSLLNEWLVDNAGRNRKCANDPGATTFTRIEKRACADANANEVHFTQTDIDGNSAELFFQNNCAYCHSQGNPAGTPVAPKVATYDEGLGFDVIDLAAGDRNAGHPYYADLDGSPLSFWQMSVLRALDGSMPPYGGVDPADPAFDMFRRWVESGYPDDACP